MEQLRKKAVEILLVRSYNKTLSLKVAELERHIIYLQDQLESEKQFKEQQVKEFKNKEKLLLAQVKKLQKHEEHVEALKEKNSLMYE